MSYKEFHRHHWNSLAREFGETTPLRAVISRDNDLVNYYFDKTTKRMLGRLLRFKQKRVLDLGCGIGRLSVWMAPKAQHITGVDISEDMIRLARRSAVSLGVPNVNFRVYDGTTLPYNDSSFDVIVCTGVLKYVVDDADLSKVIEEMCRCVSRGGQIAVIDQFDYAGPVELSAEEDLGGMSVLRHPTGYVSRFEEHGMQLVDQCSIYRKRFQTHGRAVLEKLPLGRFIADRPLTARAMADADVQIDGLLRHRVKPMRGFQLLGFVRRF